MAPICRHTLPGVYDQATVEWAAQGPFVKVADPRAIPIAMTTCRQTFYRPCFLPGDSGEGDCPDGAAWAATVIASIRGESGVWPAYLGFRNEMIPTAANVTQYLRYRAALRQAGFTGLVVFGSFSVGRPDFGEWAGIVAAFGQDRPDAVELHEYWSLTIQWGRDHDLTLRHLLLFSQNLIPSSWTLFIGECGSDNLQSQGVYEDSQQRHGWNDRQKLLPDQFATQLGSYGVLCHPNVLAAFVFADGDNGDPQWASYRTMGQPAIEQAEQASWGNVAPKKGVSVRLGIIPENQNDPAQDPSPNAADNCGPATANEMARYLGVLPNNENIAVTLAEETGEPNWLGYTYTYQMAGWFTGLLGVPAVQTQPADVVAALVDAVGRGWTAAYLRYWDEQNLTGGHFEAIDGYETDAQGNRTWYAANSWDGSWETFTDDELRGYSVANWLVIVQQGKKIVEDPIITTARNKARMANAAITFNETGALFLSWVRKVRAWINSGQDNAVDPGYWVVSETVVGQAGQRVAGTMLADGGILLAYEAKGWVAYMAEQKDRAALIKTFGWSLQ